ncbi:metal ABC transporter solute-binding protein, Zn/Mn family [Weissella koreensis]|uniref:Zinc ABC transporter substrate-binding protein n=1 Tax=Weissella koreensis TaxID=165096 RepID=A0A7H1MLN8_9LACO|nr:zinc ABC transporter substrate-binding protein [Weissella koreensis]AVH75170.1 zinc ABC transporter substrate-binding protein [Weissella koreensis]EJF33584.1 hypothetical protein JC2156_09460 [Weissella koreensis KCTC 3621]QGN20395.1 zinc ABC transporter substrate-binding protein [Weissella koreensis]QNT64374.1 zinc ABC transporter substrate-binding protein [Weissella koreensis]
MQKKNRRLRWVLIPVIAVIILLGLIFQRAWQNEKANQGLEATKKINIVTSLAVYGEMAKAVVGNRGQVDSILTKASIDPHEYEPSVETAKQYAKAQLIISNGAGYDAWSTKFAKANQKAQKINVNQVVGYQAGDNEHFWYQPMIAKQMMQPLVDKLSSIDPASKSYFEANAKKYMATLRPLENKRNKLSVQLKGKKIMVTEPVYDNALTGLGVKNINQNFSRAIEAGNDPIPTDVLAWNDTLKQGEVAFVVNNPQAENTVTKRAVSMARQDKVPVVEVTETKPDDKNYLQWQLEILDQIEEALKS